MKSLVASSSAFGTPAAERVLENVLEDVDR